VQAEIVEIDQLPLLPSRPMLGEKETRCVQQHEQPNWSWTDDRYIIEVT
jgi:hypothetical protein